MQTFVIERGISGIGGSTASELHAISQKSCEVLSDVGDDVQWVQSYVTDDKIYCVYQAESEDLVREHGRRGGFPVDTAAVVRAVIDPRTAEAGPA